MKVIITIVKEVVSTIEAQELRDQVSEAVKRVPNIKISAVCNSALDVKPPG